MVQLFFFTAVIIYFERNNKTSFLKSEEISEIKNLKSSFDC